MFGSQWSGSANLATSNNEMQFRKQLYQLDWLYGKGRIFLLYSFFFQINFVLKLHSAVATKIIEFEIVTRDAATIVNYIFDNVRAQNETYSQLFEVLCDLFSP